jgi:hypothetical protein
MNQLAHAPFHSPLQTGPLGYAERNENYWRRNLAVCVFGSFTAVGGLLPEWIGIRGTFFAGGAMIALAALLTIFLVKEDFHPADASDREANSTAAPARRTSYGVVAALLVRANRRRAAVSAFPPESRQSCVRATTDDGRADRAARRGANNRHRG